jgi:hypothetical protein
LAGTIELAAPIDFQPKVIKMKVWSPKAGMWKKSLKISSH